MSATNEQDLRDEISALRAEVRALKQQQQQQQQQPRQQQASPSRERESFRKKFERSIDLRREVRLVPAPRRVPPEAAVGAFFGGTFARVGYAILAFSSIFVVAFPLNSELVTPFVFAGPLAHTTGAVVGGSYTGASVGRRLLYTNSRPVLGTRFQYEVGGNTYQQISYSTGFGTLTDGASVDVEYTVGDPSVARIVGMRYKVFPSMVTFVLIFPLLGICLILPRIISAPKTLRLYRSGQITYGLLIDKRPSGVVVNGMPMMSLTFQFQLPGSEAPIGTYSPFAYTPCPVSYEVVHTDIRTHAVEDEVWEPILYDPLAPQSNAMLVDGLEGVVIDQTGEVRATPGVWLNAAGPVGLLVIVNFMLLAMAGSL